VILEASRGRTTPARHAALEAVSGAAKIDAQCQELLGGEVAVTPAPGA
jgi:hypothetical protein